MNFRALLEKVKAGFDYNPGCSDLDDEQPIHVRMTLGDYRQVVRLLAEQPHADNLALAPGSLLKARKLGGRVWEIELPDEKDSRG